MTRVPFFLSFGTTSLFLSFLTAFSFQDIPASACRRKTFRPLRSTLRLFWFFDESVFPQNSSSTSFLMTARFHDASFLTLLFVGSFPREEDISFDPFLCR